MTHEKLTQLSTPFSVLAAGLLIAGAVLWNNSNPVKPTTALQPQGAEQATGNLDAMEPVGANDHIRGDPDAPVKIVEYSDTVGIPAFPARSAPLKSGKFDAHIEDNVQNAQATGGNGTPWSIVVAKSGKKYPLSSAQPYEAVKQLIESALREK